jgi:hypothetical protein
MKDEPTLQEWQTWADEAQACVDSGDVVISDHRKAQATIAALREHAGLKARITELEGALKFYRDEWRMNGDGDSETPGLSRSWMEPTDALHNDEGRKAAAVLQSKAGS